jgi:hypothetical protein
LLLFAALTSVQTNSGLIEMILRKAFCVTRRTEYSLKITSAPFVASFAFSHEKKYQSIAQSFAAKIAADLTGGCLTCPFPQEQPLPELHAAALGWDWRKGRRDCFENYVRTNTLTATFPLDFGLCHDLSDVAKGGDGAKRQSRNVPNGTPICRDSNASDSLYWPANLI